MAYINLNIYEEIEAKDFIDFIKSSNSICASMSNKDLLTFIDENIYLLVETYLDKLGIEYGDIDWGDGIDELYKECIEYLNA